ncbi:MAG: RDD family protein [Alphaproteobacteria bacterium]|nr:RDD family protein [Alphaproteobacteria bacterium]
MASFGYAATFYDEQAMPDPAALPEAYEGVLWRRTLAYFVDLCVIGVLAAFCWVGFAVLWLLSFGLLAPVLWFLFGLIPLAYHTLLLSGPWSATIGMRLFDVELRSITGERPGFLQALIQTALFYLTVGATCSLILLLVLFNRHKRTLHDMLAGTVIVRRFRLRRAAAHNPDWRS